MRYDIHCNRAAGQVSRRAEAEVEESESIRKDSPAAAGDIAGQDSHRRRRRRTVGGDASV